MEEYIDQSHVRNLLNEFVSSILKTSYIGYESTAQYILSTRTLLILLIPYELLTLPCRCVIVKNSSLLFEEEDGAE